MMQSYTQINPIDSVDPIATFTVLVTIKISKSISVLLSVKPWL